jgi:hypothetical protein
MQYNVDSILQSLRKKYLQFIDDSVRLLVLETVALGENLSSH